jgi:hypothetical protein
MTEVYYGDLSRISAEDLDHIDEVSRKHIVPLSMQPGDTLLIDNYRCVGVEWSVHARGEGGRLPTILCVAVHSFALLIVFSGLVSDRRAHVDDST